VIIELTYRLHTQRVVGQVRRSRREGIGWVLAYERIAGTCGLSTTAGNFSICPQA